MSQRNDCRWKSGDEKLVTRSRQSLFEQKLQSLSDSFYSSIIDESLSSRKQRRSTEVRLKTADELTNSKMNNFTFEQCSLEEKTFSQSDQFSFTFHSIDQSKQETRTSVDFDLSKIDVQRKIHSSTPNSTIKTQRDEPTLIVEQKPDRTKLPSSSVEPKIIGYYPVISYQPVPPVILFDRSMQDKSL